ncbi:hypothetical protein BG004_002468 [Podila humilis]|nr:hypothetical protein BG004_002468 [Podila humilis]
MAQVPNARVYLFSNRCSPRFYGPSDAKAAVAFLHAVDSFVGTSEYLILSFANHKTKRMLQRHKITSTDLPDVQGPQHGMSGCAAKYRDARCNTLLLRYAIARMRVKTFAQGTRRDQIYGIAYRDELSSVMNEGSEDDHDNLDDLFSQNLLSKIVTHFSRVASKSKGAELDELEEAPMAESSNSIHHIKINVENLDPGSPSLWDQLSQQIFRLLACPPIPSRDTMSQTAQAHIRQASVMIDNLWHGSIYNKSVDYLLRFLLRAWLAPKRETATKERSATYAADKLELANKRLKRRTGRLSPSHWRYAMRRLCDQLADCTERASTAVQGEQSAIRRRRSVLRDMVSLSKKDSGQGLWDRTPVMHLEIPLEASLEDEDFSFIEEEDEPIDVLDAVEQECMEANGDRVILNHSVPSTATVPRTLNETSESLPAVTEPSRKRLKSVQTLLKVLVESPSQLQQYSLNDVKDAAYKDHCFADTELEVVRDFANKFRPYLPRRWLNEKSDTHALHLGPQQLFETLCAPSPGHFDIEGADGTSLTSIADVTALKANKMTIFNSFFDLDKVESLCWQPGLQFNNRLSRKTKAKTVSPELMAPTWDFPAAETTAQQLDVTQLLEHHCKVVSDVSDDAMEIDQKVKPTEIKARSRTEILESREQAQELKLPPAIKVISKQLQQTSFTHKYMKERERALNDLKNAAASNALKAMSTKEAALSSATTLKQIDNATLARRLAKADIRRFNNTRHLKKLRRTKRHRDHRAVAKAASHARGSATEHAGAQAQSESTPPSIEPATGYCSSCNEYELQKPTESGLKHPTISNKSSPINLWRCSNFQKSGAHILHLPL